jgi:hypothetical protein
MKDKIKAKWKESADERAELKKIRKEAEMKEKKSLEKYKVKQKYKEKRRKLRESVKPGKASSFLFGGASGPDVNMVTGSPDPIDHIFGKSGSSTRNQGDPLGSIFGSQKYTPIGPFTDIYNPKKKKKS